MTVQFQELMERVLRVKTSGVAPHISGDTFYAFRNRLVGSKLHGGIDFNYVGGQGPENVAGANNVYAPVSGEVVALQDSQGGVIIRSDLDGTLHRILHLNTTIVEVGDPVVAGSTPLGTLGGKGTYKRIDTTGDGEKDTSVFYAPPGQTPQPVPGNLLFGPGAHAVHIHYDVYLPDGTDTDGLLPLTNWDATDLKIDSIAYWSTGLQTSSVALADINGNGTYDTQGYLEEGKTKTFSVNVNTPHTREMYFLVDFSKSSIEPNRLTITAPDSNVTVVNSSYLGDTNTAILRLNFSVNQATPHTSFTFKVHTGEDDNFTMETTTLNVEAVYLKNGNWVPYENFGTVEQKVIHILDNDNPNSGLPAPLIIKEGTDEHDAGLYDPLLDNLGVSGGGTITTLISTGTYLPLGGVDTAVEVEPYIQIDGIYNAARGYGGDDVIVGPRGGSGITIFGGADDDWLIADPNRGSKKMGSDTVLPVNPF